MGGDPLGATKLFGLIPTHWHILILWPADWKVYAFLYFSTVALFKWLKEKFINRDQNNKTTQPENPNPCPKDTP